MNERQRKILTDAFVLLGGAVRKGKRLAATGTEPEVREHVVQMGEMCQEMVKALDQSIGAANVLDLASARGRRAT